MDDLTIRGLTGVAIGVTLFLMGYARGRRQGLHSAVDYMFKIGILSVDEKGNIVAGPKLRNK